MFRIAISGKLYRFPGQTFIPLEGMVVRGGFEPPTPWFVAKYSIQLSYRTPNRGKTVQYAQFMRYASKNILAGG